MKTAEELRLREAREEKVQWKKWGPYLSERQWGTVREDYSEGGDAWDYFTHDQARSRAYRWGEDGIAGISDDKQRLCFALALWNGKDPILKERLFGLTNSEGNHGEDVKEYYFYLDSTPTHSYMKFLYKYPQAAFPYADLVETNRRRTRNEMEYELLDTGVFDDDRYFDVFVEYAKGGAEDILVQITAVNRGPEAAELHLLPTLWFRNDWAGWIAESNRAPTKPNLKQIKEAARHERGGGRASGTRGVHSVLRGRGAAALHRERNQLRALFRASPTRARTSRTASTTTWCMGHQGAVNPEKRGPRSRPTTGSTIGPGQSATVRLRLRLPGHCRRSRKTRANPFGTEFDEDPGRPAARGGRVLPVRDPAVGRPGRGQRDAPGHRRHALEQAVLLLRR